MQGQSLKSAIDAPRLISRNDVYAEAEESLAMDAAFISAMAKSGIEVRGLQAEDGHYRPLGYIEGIFLTKDSKLEPVADTTRYEQARAAGY